MMTNIKYHKISFYNIFIKYFRVIVLIPEEAEDMWQAYNIIRKGDQIRASTIRYLWQTISH